MKKRTNRALVVSLGLHVAVMLAVSPFLINHFDAEKESISAEILKPESEEQIRKRVLPPRTPLVPQVSKTAESSPSSPASPTYSPEVSVPKAPVHADVVPDVVTYTDVPQTDTPSPVSNASFGEDGILAGPVVIEGQRGSGVGRPGSGGSGMGGRFAQGTGVSDAGLEMLDSIDAGLGIFGTDVMPGHGLVGEVFVPRGPIERMPDFDRLTPVDTFITPNLDVPKRNYTRGFPTPEMPTVVENFAIRFRGQLAIDTPGKYHFGLYSDDGSKLYVDGKLIIDNDGIHAPKGEHGSITLLAGTYPVEIQYFQGPRESIALQWYYQPPTGEYSQASSKVSITTPAWNWHWESSRGGRIVPPEVIYRPGIPRIPAALKKLQQRIKNIDEIDEQ